MNTIYLALLLISAATLAFQVALTRFFALAQGHHLAFMAISLALLGAGASGTYLSLKQPKAADLPQTINGWADVIYFIWACFLFGYQLPALSTLIAWP